MKIRLATDPSRLKQASGFSQAEPESQKATHVLLGDNNTILSYLKGAIALCERAWAGGRSALVVLKVVRAALAVLLLEIGGVHSSTVRGVADAGKKSAEPSKQSEWTQELGRTKRVGESGR